MTVYPTATLAPRPRPSRWQALRAEVRRWYGSRYGGVADWQRASVREALGSERVEMSAPEIVTMHWDASAHRRHRGCSELVAMSDSSAFFSMRRGSPWPSIPATVAWTTLLALLLTSLVAKAQGIPDAEIQRPAVCSATLSGPFHLRPVVTGARIGREIAGPLTTVDVLSLTGLWRTRDNAVLARVRVPSLASEGFAFVRAAEFAINCPLISLGQHGGPVPHTAEELADNPARRRRPRWPAWSVNDRRDYTGDGRPDDLVIVGDPDYPSAGDYMLRWREAGRLAFATITMHDDRLRHVSSVRPLATLPTPLIVWSHSDIALTDSCSTAGAAGGVEYPITQESFYRWHESGRIVEVWRWARYENAEGLRVEPTPDGNLVLVGESTGRRQRLLWDATRFTFVPEGPTFPTEENFTFRCNPSPRAPYEDRE